MDVAKYIGLFLLKNEQCYIHGLGTLQFSRKPAAYDGQNLQAPSHEIIMVQGGNVDESLANYIATNEQISITKASNALRDFSTDTKNTLQAGNLVPLPHLGKFTFTDGRIGFITDPHLQYKTAPIKAQKGVSLQHNERPPIPHQPYIPTTPIGSPLAAPGQPPASPHMQQYMHQQEEPERLNWARIIFVLLLLIVMAGGAYYAYERYMAPKARTVKPALSLPEDVNEEPEQTEFAEESILPVDSAIVDSLGNEPEESIQATPAPATEQNRNAITSQNTKNGSPVTPQQPPAKYITLKAVLNTFDNKDEAYARKRSLSAKGLPVEVIEEDTNYYFVIMNVKTTNPNNKQVLDSISNLYNPEGVFPY